MPFRPEHSLLRVEVPHLHTVDTSSVEALMGMWSLFSKTSHAMEDGKRLENLSWRLWNRETFCCAPESQRPLSRSLPSQRRIPPRAAATSGDLSIPALSSSLDYASSSDDDFDVDSTSHTITPRIPRARPGLRRNESGESTRSRGREKHITPIDLEKIVISIKETSRLEPIELSMPTPALPAAEPPSTTVSQVLSRFDLDDEACHTASSNATPHTCASHTTALESSASTVATGSQNSHTSQPVGSQDSSSTEMSGHSIVHGFTKPSSYRSHTNLASTQPTPILKTTSPHLGQPPPEKRAKFILGSGSSAEDESSLETHMLRSALSESLKSSNGTLQSSKGKKQTSFKDEIAVARAAAARHSPVFESDDEEDEVSESAIEDDDDSSDWEDSDDQSGPSSVNDSKDLFQRVDSRPNLSSRRSLLTTMMHEPDRAKAMQNAASKSQPALRRSRTSTPNGPSVATSPTDNGLLHPKGQKSIPKPIITTTNTTQPLALSPRTTRRHMLSTELTESLRKNLLWERQHRSTGNLAAMKRRHTSNDVKNLKQHPEPVALSQKDPSKFNNDYFHQGLGEYHAKGW
ncbi:hypothetical protein DOTSEDRAFT_68419 [Dothistroma septosporum NZE10]|uniref:Uncharacterized protein n=1 Tax=Dothistroma septosporum (strain NZE10 / CBS 128990) TaxID=675120 RepID=N1Q4Q5_DOTSN|nr:hypothetical protein DOTSEDRAFT_68419 [Dothistroma septosporum NZE10]